MEVKKWIKKRPAELFAERFRISNENRDVMEAMAAMRHQKNEEHRKDQEVAMRNPSIYWK